MRWRYFFFRVRVFSKTVNLACWLAFKNRLVVGTERVQIAPWYFYFVFLMAQYFINSSGKLDTITRMSRRNKSFSTTRFCWQKHLSYTLKTERKFRKIRALPVNQNIPTFKSSPQTAYSWSGSFPEIMRRRVILICVCSCLRYPNKWLKTTLGLAKQHCWYCFRMSIIIVQWVQPTCYT